MMPVAKHGDPQLGVDVHMCVVPPSPSPVPLPTPHMSIVFDPFDYVPFLGATVTVCGMKRAVAGTSGQVVHIPPGFPFSPTPKLPDKDDELFMGSATVVADGDPLSFLAVPVLGCQMVGMPSPPRPKRKGGPRAMLLPTTVNLAIPTSVFVGGPPTISLLGTAFKLGFAGLGGFAKSRRGLALAERFAEWRKAKWGHLNPGFLKCAVLRAEPVNIVTGAVSVEQEDFTLPGLIPIRWTRRYASDNPRRGACGVGWECPADARLEHDAGSGVVLFRHPEGGIAVFPAAPQTEGEVGAVLELMDGALLSDHGPEFRVRTKEDRIYRFPKSLARDAVGGEREYPLGQVGDLCGNTLTYERSPNGRLLAIRESAGRRIEVESGADGLIRQVALRVPESGFRHVYAEYGQDAAGDLAEVRDALGNPCRFAYDEHRMRRHTDRNGLSFYYEYDESGEGWRVVRSWGDGGLYAYKFAYLDAVNERRITDSLGHVSLVKLDERGLPISEIDALGGVTAYEYDDVGRTTAVVDQDRHRTKYEYDEKGNLLGLKRPDGSAVAVDFSPANKPMRVVDPNGHAWLQEHDMCGRPLRRVSPLGAETRYERRPGGLPVALIDPSGARTSFEHDAYGNLCRFTNALGGVTFMDHDVFGNLIACEEPMGFRTTFRYDGKQRLVTVRRYSGSSTSYEYDFEDRVVGHTDSAGCVTKFEYFGVDCLARRVQPDGQTVEYTYDTEERLIAIRNQRGEFHRLNRDPLGRVVREVDYWGRATRHGYSPCGHLQTSVDPLGRTMRIQTDAVGRITLREPVAATPAAHEAERYVYDHVGNLVAFENVTTRVTCSFDAEGRPIRECQGGDAEAVCVYDGRGLLLTRKIKLRASGHEVSTHVDYTYDALGRPVEVRAGDKKVLTREYDPLGRVRTDVIGHAMRRKFEHAADGALIRQQLWLNSAIVSKQDYAYDKGGNLVERSDSEFGRQRYAYDQMSRLVLEEDATGRRRHYATDSAGDRLIGAEVAGHGHEGWNHVARFEDAQYRFDSIGNLVERRNSLGVLGLTWNLQGRLSECRWEDGRGGRYRYDAMGRRIEKEVSGVVTRFIWSGDLLVGEAVVFHPDVGEAAEGSCHIRMWAHDPGGFVPLVVAEEAVGAEAMAERMHVNLVHTDPNGCPLRLINLSGETVWSARYGGWGRAFHTPAQALENPLRLQGQYEDPESGLHYNRFRYYDPDAGHFISPDPLGLRAGDNPYRYAPNIWAWVDPLGLACRYDPNIQRWRGPDGRFRSAPLDPIDLVNNGKIDFNDVQQWARQHGLPNNWGASPQFPTGGFRYQNVQGSVVHTAWGHGVNPNAVVQYPGSNAALGPTASMRRDVHPKPHGPAERGHVSGSYRPGGADVNGEHIPLDNSPY